MKMVAMKFEWFKGERMEIRSGFFWGVGFSVISRRISSLIWLVQGRN